jgi:uncharacterized protein DUF1579
MNRIAALVTILVFAFSLWSQNPPAMPKPGPEHQRLHYYAGDWKVEGEAKPSPFGPGGKFTSTDHDEMLGDFFLLIHSEGNGPMGPQKSVAALGYDPKEKVYTYDGFTTYGEHGKATGTVSGDTWNWTFSGDEGGKSFKGRITIKELSSTAYTFTEEMSIDGGPWTKSVEAKATKQ